MYFVHNIAGALRKECPDVTENIIFTAQSESRGSEHTRMLQHIVLLCKCAVSLSGVKKCTAGRVAILLVRCLHSFFKYTLICSIWLAQSTTTKVKTAAAKTHSEHRLLHKCVVSWMCVYICTTWVTSIEVKRKKNKQTWIKWFYANAISCQHKHRPRDRCKQNVSCDV